MGGLTEKGCGLSYWFLDIQSFFAGEHGSDFKTQLTKLFLHLALLLDLGVRVLEKSWSHGRCRVR